MNTPPRPLSELEAHFAEHTRPSVILSGTDWVDEPRARGLRREHYPNNIQATVTQFEGDVLIDLTEVANSHGQFIHPRPAHNRIRLSPETARQMAEALTLFADKLELQQAVSTEEK